MKLLRGDTDSVELRQAAYGLATMSKSFPPEKLWTDGSRPLLYPYP